MEREEIIMSDIYTEGEEIPWDNSKSGYSWVKDRKLNYDAEKNMVDVEVIFQRISDGKYFKVTYTQYNHCGNSLEDETAIEVFPKQVVSIIYE
jgi:hypothetical protein